MKLQKFAITAFALSMAAAYAGGDKYHDKEKRAMSADSNTHLSVNTKEAVSAPEKASPEGAPAGYADKSATAEVTMQKDTIEGQARADTTIAATSTEGANGSTPAGYSDKSAAATDKTGQKDTKKAQKQPDAGKGAMAAAPAQPGAPAGHADKASAPADNAEQKDTQAGQAK